MEKAREITVKGIGNYTVSPDFIKVEFELKKTDKNYQKGYKQFQKDIQEFQKVIVDFGFDNKDLKASNIYTSEDYDYLRNKKEFLGYKFVCQLELGFDLDTDKLEKLLNEVGKTPLKPFISLHFSVKDEEAVKDKLLGSAAQMARNKAEILCSALGAKLGTIKRISYNWDEIDIESETRFSLHKTELNLKCLSKACAIEGDSIEFNPKDIVLKDEAYFIWEIE